MNSHTNNYIIHDENYTHENVAAENKRRKELKESPIRYITFDLGRTDAETIKDFAENLNEQNLHPNPTIVVFGANFSVEQQETLREAGAVIFDASQNGAPKNILELSGSSSPKRRSAFSLEWTAATHEIEPQDETPWFSQVAANRLPVCALGEIFTPVPRLGQI